MAVDKLINQTQGDEIINALSDISEKLEDVTTMTPAKLGFGYAVCDTAASTAAKTANLANYQLTEGSVVFVKFTNGSTATNPTLNLNNTGAKPMYYRGAAVEPDVIVAGDIGIFVYSTNVYNLVSTDAGGLDAVLSVGAEGGIITDQTGGADIERTGKVKLNLKSDTAFTAAAPNPTEVSGRVYPVALDSAGHPAVGVPWTDTTYTQAANSAITVDNTNHTIGVAAGTTSTAGVVQLTDSYTSTSTTTAATPNSVKAAYDLADSKYAKPNTGISKDDLEDGVKTSLGKADTALQTFTETDPTVPAWAKQSTKPSYTASEVGAIATTAKGTANGVAELDANGKVPSAQLPSYVDDVLEYSAKSSFPATGETGKIYVDTTTNKTYRWGGSAYVEISESLALGDTSSTAYYGDKGKTAYEHSQVTSGNPHNVTASDVGLGNVGNFKAVSTVASQGLSDTEKSNARANIGAGTSSFSGSYSDLSNKPTLGTAAAKDVPSSGNASTSQVVMGNDSRLSDARTPTSHSHTKSQITDFPTSMPASDVPAWAKASTKPTYTASEVNAVATTTNQSLTDAQKSNARYNIGAATSSFGKVKVTGNKGRAKCTPKMARGGNWTAKTWSGLTDFLGGKVWTDGDNIYYSNSSSQYILDKSTSTWTTKTWSGLTDFNGASIWTDGDNIYYSNSSSNQYILDKSTSTWTTKTWSGFTNFRGDRIWTDGDNIYYSANSTTHYVLDKSTSTWTAKTWSGFTNFRGDMVWTDGDNIYCSNSSSQYILDKSTSTWTTKTWSGLTDFNGASIWTDGDNIYYSSTSSNEYVLNKSTSTWTAKTWSGLTDFNFSASNIWTDGDNIYYSNNTTHYVLCQP